MENKVLIIGCGKMGAFYDSPDNDNILSYAKAFKSDSHFNVVGLIDTDIERLKLAGEIWNVDTYMNIQEAIKSCGKVDVIINSVPDNYHYEVIMEAIKYSPQIIITEKPLTKNYEQALEVKSELEKTNTTLLINYSRRYIPEYIDLKNRIRAKEFGEFIGGNGHYGKGLLHNGSHMIDLLSYFFESYNDATVSSVIYDCYEDDPSLNLSIDVQGANFNLVAIDSSYFTIFDMDLYFSKAKIEFRNSGFEIVTYEVKENEFYKGYRFLNENDNIHIDLSSSLIGLVANVKDILSGKGQPLCSIDDGVSVVELWEKLKNQY